MKQKTSYTKNYLELEPLWYEVSPMLKMLFSAIKYNEENYLRGEYSYIVDKIERRMKKINDLF